MLSGETVPTFEESPRSSPFIHEFFMVEVEGFRGMAYCDENGKWRTAYKDEELPGTVYIFE